MSSFILTWFLFYLGNGINGTASHSFPAGNAHNNNNSNSTTAANNNNGAGDGNQATRETGIIEKLLVLSLFSNGNYL